VLTDAVISPPLVPNVTVGLLENALLRSEPCRLNDTKWLLFQLEGLISYCVLSGVVAVSEWNTVTPISASVESED
jgi:hypothetical protein